ncbi:hypothetical protein SP90_00920 [Halodesulfovibrio spirochaetisodalis]|uniref:Uncharacterized protein n=1 Tax=Halodesulfovibrio spirochaetisodalis TaxID=1560234 RepID=A0A1B7XQ39_9BACT|nr:hypothetical protein SP90_00920 [Halodesulfovibrio spirochaetisodalis]
MALSEMSVRYFETVFFVFLTAVALFKGLCNGGEFVWKVDGFGKRHCEYAHEHKSVYANY